jgi:Zn-dependent protease/CBS domain-containing protein
MGYSFSIGRVFGIEVRLHFSLLFILSILVLIFYNRESPYGFSNLEQTTRLVLSILMSVLIFVSVFLHELSHSLVAMRFGARVKAIMLFIFGGVAMIEDLPKDPNREFFVAIAGPLMSFLLALVGFSLRLLGGLFGEFCYLFGYFNLVLGLFNLIPAFPMDGGRVLRSFLTRRLGFIRATKISADVGKILAVVIGVTGLFTSIWLTLIALFIYMGAVEEEKSVTLEGFLSKYVVGDVMSKNPICVSPEFKARDVIDLVFKHKHLGYPVVENDRVVGIVTLRDVINAGEDEDVRDVMSRNVLTVTPETSVLEALRIMSERKIGRLPVVENSDLVGIVSRSDVVRLLEILELLEMRK